MSSIVRKKRLILNFLKIAVFLNGVLLCFPNVSAERLPVKTYTVADGLLRDIVYRIKQDSRGFLWFCTAEGISRFDGAGMTNFTVRDGLPARFVHDFLETRDGAILIATGKGLARLNPNGQRSSQENPLFTVILPDRETAERITVLFEDRSGKIFAGTSDGLFKLTESTLEAVDLGVSSIVVTDIIEDRRGSLWVGTNKGLFRLAQDGDVRRMTTTDNLQDDSIYSLLEDRDGQIWVGFRPVVKGGLCLLDAEFGNERVKECFIKEKDGLSSNWITDLLQTNDGRIWAAAVSGLCLWQGERGGKGVCKTYNSENNLCDGINSLAEDKDGNLWAAGCGAKKIARYGFTTYTVKDGLGYDKVNSIFEDREGRLFISTAIYKRKISLFDGEKFLTITPRLSESVNDVGWGWQQTVWQDSKDMWWIPTGVGVFRTPPVDFEKLVNVTAQKQPGGIEGNEAFRLFEDARGDVWVGGGGREDNNIIIWRWERSSGIWHDYTRQIGSKRLVSAFVEDANGSIWIGTGSDDSVGYYKGILLRYRDGELRVFEEKDGAPRGWTRDLFVDSRGRLWIASTEDGLLRLDDTNSDRLNFVRYTPAEGLTSSATACVTEDEFGRIYVGTWRGIDRLDLETGHIENFTTADGLPAGFVETAYRDRQNNLWFATSDGLARFRPEPVRKRNPPTILITNLRIAGEALPISILGEKEIPPLDLAPDQNQISIDFLGLGASLGEELKYEYRFAGSNWTSVGDERTVNFANLKAGEYRFEVRAVTADKIYSLAPAVVSYRIAAPIWQRLWFIASVIFLIAVLIYLFYSYRLNKLLEIERTRTRIASDLHDDIGTNLSKISLMTEIVNLQLADENRKHKQMLASIAEISRQSVTSMSDIVWAINPQRDSLHDLTSRMINHVEQLFEERDEVKVNFHIPDQNTQIRIPMDIRRDLYLILKEAVGNAAKHSNCKNLEISLLLEGGSILLMVSDNGRGFDPGEDSEGNGLNNMRRRAEQSGGSFQIESQKDKGTTIKVRFPQN